MKNGKKLKVKALVDSGCTHTGIDEQLVKDKRIQTKPINFLFEVFNTNGTKNREVTKVAPLEIKNQWTQRNLGSSSNRPGWNRHVSRTRLVGQT